jgi:long-chain acyl-CoA synthetase
MCAEGPLGVPRWAALRPDADAYVGEDGRCSFSALYAGAAAGAALLADLGVGPGDRVGLALRNRRQYIEISLAAWMRDAILVPFGYRSTRDEMEYLAADARLSVVVREEDGAEPRGVTSLTWAEFERRAASYEIPPPRADAAPLVERVLPYTSGTTGRPKSLRRHGFPDGVSVQDPGSWLSQFPMGFSEGVHLCVAAMYHAQPRLFTHAALDWGHTVVMMRHFDPEAALRLIEVERVTWISMAPIHFVRMLKLGRDAIDRYRRSTVGFIVHSASPVSVAVKREMLELFPGALWEMYGGTEGTFTVIGPDEWLAKPGSVGRTTPGRDLSIRDVDGRPVPPGEVGVIYRHEPDPALRFEYAGDPGATRKAWQGEYFTLGDMGYLDQDGYLYLTDRSKDLIVRGGVNIYSAAVEAVLIDHPDVLDVAVIGIPDDEYGEAVLAVIESATRPDPAVLIDFCRSRLSPDKCPSAIEYVDALPREPTGKLRKRYLRDQYWKGRERAI